MILFLENNIPGSISSVMGARYLKSDGKKKTLYSNFYTSYEWAVIKSQHLDEIKFGEDVKKQKISKTSDDSDFLQVDKKHPDGKKKRERTFQFIPRLNIIIRIILVNI